LKRNHRRKEKKRKEKEKKGQEPRLPLGSQTGAL
jgi:hypothetical protein